MHHIAYGIPKIFPGVIPGPRPGLGKCKGGNHSEISWVESSWVGRSDHALSVATIVLWFTRKTLSPLYATRTNLSNYTQQVCRGYLFFVLLFDYKRIVLHIFRVVISWREWHTYIYVAINIWSGVMCATIVERRSSSQSHRLITKLVQDIVKLLNHIVSLFRLMCACMCVAWLRCQPISWTPGLWPEP